MTQYLISFDSGWMVIPDGQLREFEEATVAVAEEARAAGVWVYGGGLEDQRATIVAPDGVVTDGPFPETKEVIGGFVVLELDSKDEALAWAAKLAVACRCPQEVRELLPEPTL